MNRFLLPLALALIVIAFASVILLTAFDKARLALHAAGF